MVRTSFVTSFGGDIVAQTEPMLTRLVNAESERLRKEAVRELPKYEYPMHIATAAMLQRYSKYGVELKIHRADCEMISVLDAQRPAGKKIFGGGLLLSDSAAAERAAAERAAAERAAAECAAAERAAAERAAAERAAAEVWELSPREREMVEYINRRGRVSTADT